MESRVQQLVGQLAVPEASAQRQAAVQLAAALAAKKLSDVRRFHESEEYKALQGQLTNASPNVVSSCANAIVRVVAAIPGAKFLTETVHHFLAALPLLQGAGATALLEALTALLCVAAKRTAGPEAISADAFATAPFTSVLRDRPELWMALWEQIERALGPGQENYRGRFDIFAPFFRTVLLETSPPATRAGLVPVLHGTIARAAAAALNPVVPAGGAAPTAVADALYIAGFLIELLPCHPTDTPQAMAFVVAALRDITDVLSFVADHARTTTTSAGSAGGALPAALAELCAIFLRALLVVLRDVSAQQHAVRPVLNSLGDMLERTCAWLPAAQPRLYVTCLHVLALQLASAASQTEEVQLSSLIAFSVNEWAPQASELMDGEPAAAAYLYYSIVCGVASSSALIQQACTRAQNALDTWLSRAPGTAKKSIYATGAPGAEGAEATTDLRRFGDAAWLITGLWGSPEAALTYMNDITGTLGPHAVTPHFRCMTTSLLMHPATTVRTAAVELIARAAAVAPLPTLAFLPIILHRLNAENSKEVRVALVHLLPALGTDPACVAPVIRVLATLYQTPSLQPLVMIAFVKLWRLQDRIFSRLQAIMMPVAAKQPEELRIARALAVRDICRHKAQLHGAQVVSMLSKSLREDTSEIVAILGVEALDALCEADVMDFSLAHAVVAKRLGREQRLRVVVPITYLLRHGSRDAEDDPWTAKDTVASLWAYVKSRDAPVREAALKSLAVYSTKDIEGRYTPEDLAETEEEAEAARKANEGKGGDDEERPPSCHNITPTVYLDILQDAAAPPRAAAIALVAGLVLEETALTAIKRGRPKVQGDPRAARSRVLTTAGTLMQGAWAGDQRPSVRPGLSGAMLSCFTPPGPEKNTAATSRKHLIAQGGVYGRTLKDLLGDAQAGDWLASSLLPEAWANFMSRAVPPLIAADGARASLEAKQPEREALDEIRAANNALPELLSNLQARREQSPDVAENCLHAIAGVAEARLPSGRAITETHYPIVESVVDALLSASRPSTEAQARAAALTGLARAASMLRATDTERLTATVNALVTGLRGSGARIANACAIGIGLFARGLASRAEAPGAMNGAAWGGSSPSALAYELEKTLIEPPMEATADFQLGAYIGIGYVATALEKAQAHDVLKRIYGTISSSLAGDASPLAQAGACVAVPSLAVRLFRIGALAPAAVTDVVSRIDAIAKSNVPIASQAATVALAAISRDLALQGFVFPADHVKKMLERFVEEVTNGASGPARSGAVFALANLAGVTCAVPDGLTPDFSHTARSAFLSNHVAELSVAKDIAGGLKEAFTNDKDMKVCRHAAWVLGALAALDTIVEAGPGAEGPSRREADSLDHLPETSLIRFLYDELRLCVGETMESATAHGHPATRTPRLAGSILTALSRTPDLPAVNWAPLLQRLLQMEAGGAEQRAEIRLGAVQLAVRVAASSAGTVGLLSTLTETAQLMALEEPLQRTLITGLPVLANVYAPSRIATLVTVLATSLPARSPLRSVHLIGALEQCLAARRVTAVAAGTSVAGRLSPGSDPLNIALIDAAFTLLRTADTPIRRAGTVPAAGGNNWLLDTRGGGQNPWRIDEEACTALRLLATCFSHVTKEVLVAGGLRTAVDLTGEALTGDSLDATLKSAVVWAELVRTEALPVTEFTVTRGLCMSSLLSDELSLVAAPLLLRSTLATAKLWGHQAQRTWLLDALASAGLCVNPVRALHVMAIAGCSWANCDVQLLYSDLMPTLSHAALCQAALGPLIAAAFSEKSDVQSLLHICASLFDGPASGAVRPLLEPALNVLRHHPSFRSSTHVASWRAV